ncbi:MAG: 4a-hydroxytetrahydrobiopterin dehydratase [Ignavibacterium sp.]
MSVLSNEEIQNKLKNLSDWTFTNNQIQKDYILNDFLSAIKFVGQIANIAEEIDHHPDLLIHNWNKVKIMISTHSEGGVTEKDFVLANRIEELYK